MPTKRNAFTLVELLVVITVITILAALLLPALHHARHMVKLTACGSNLRQLSTGSHLYCGDFKGRYPSRTGNTVAKQPFPFGLKSFYSSDNYDDRPHLSPYLSDDLMNCPFGKKLDLYGSEEEIVRSSYVFYGGWQITVGEVPMKKLGRLLKYGGEEYDILFADHEISMKDQFYQSSHPDKAGTLPFFIDPTYTIANFQQTGTNLHTGVDMNYARTDCSVFGVKDVLSTDPRLDKVPYKYGNHGVSLASRWSQLPPKGFSP